MSNKTSILAVILLIGISIVLFLYNRNIISGSGVSPGEINELNKIFNIEKGNNVYLILGKDYLNCGVCKDNFINVLNILNEKRKPEKISILLDKPEGKKWSKKRIKYWFDKLGIENKLLIDDSQYLTRLVEKNKALLVSTNLTNEVIFEEKMPVRYDKLDKIFNE